jgi:hypothetical protein
MNAMIERLRLFAGANATRVIQLVESLVDDGRHRSIDCSAWISDLHQHH